MAAGVGRLVSDRSARGQPTEGKFEPKKARISVGMLKRRNSESIMTENPLDRAPPAGLHELPVPAELYHPGNSRCYGALKGFALAAAGQAIRFDCSSRAIICGAAVESVWPAKRRGLKCPSSIQARARLPPKYGCSTASGTSGTMYFLDLISDPRTLRTALLRGVPGICGITKLEN